MKTTKKYFKYIVLLVALYIGFNFILSLCNLSKAFEIFNVKHVFVCVENASPEDFNKAIQNINITKIENVVNKIDRVLNLLDDTQKNTEKATTTNDK